MEWLHKCYPRRNVNMSLSEMIPSTNLVLCSIITTRRTPDDKAYSASNLNQQAQFLMKQKQLISCNNENPNILLMRSGTWIIQTSTWNTQFLQDFKQGTRLQTRMTLSSALHLVLHIQCILHSYLFKFNASVDVILRQSHDITAETGKTEN